MSAPIGHVVAGTLYLIIAVMFVTPLADSRSFFLLNVGDLYGITGLDTSLISELGPRYGFGVFEDSNGYKWLDDNNFVGLFGCNHHKHRFNTLKAFTFLTIGFSSFGLIVSFLGAASGSSGLGFASLGMSIFTIITSVIAMALGWDLWTRDHSCRGFDFTLGDHCEINYGPIFLTIAFFFSLFVPVVLAVMGTLSGVKPENEPTEEKVASA